MGSLVASINPDAARELGQRLTGTEAGLVADRLADGDTLTSALKAVAAGDRAAVRALLADGSQSSRIAVLRAIEGARSTLTSAIPLWTMPGHLARSGPLTASVSHLVDGARYSITCSTFNFQRSSGLWPALRRAAVRPGLSLRVYLDAAAARQGAPTALEVATHLRPAVVMNTKQFDGADVRNHAKFLAIDHRFLLVTSANYSWSAEHGNVEFGVLIDDRNLTEAVERELRDAEPLLYERVFFT
ncbi:DISARM system phospholipase D-like protein DrmC [Lentzea terrae]|uniref:DISARM system phospholipase D-like protein DrmC n=1 Tax=Lentzea terrae TaxID=2200761 RepID=UPI001E2EF76E|nr:DISARM system phospholipase D-like protein DrmC [Lentzea terrae]